MKGYLNMQSGIMTHYYLGSDTRSGYYTLYGSLLSSVMCRTQYIIKGGHIYGKSLFLKKIAEQTAACGFAVECYRSAANPEYLDGIFIPELGTVFIDGELPHAVNALYPGAVETYIDIGALYNNKVLKERREAIVGLTRETEKLKKKLTRYLNAAGEVRDNIREPVRTEKTVNAIRNRAGRNAAKELKRSSGTGMISYRFINTSLSGTEDYSAVMSTCGKICVLDNDLGLAHEMLDVISGRAAAAGYNVIVCLDPLEPEKAEHVMIPALSLAYISKTSRREFGGEVYKHFRLDAQPREGLTAAEKMSIKADKKLFTALMTRAGEVRADINRLAMELGDIYNPGLNIRAVIKKAEEYVGAIV